MKVGLMPKAQGLTRAHPEFLRGLQGCGVDPRGSLDVLEPTTPAGGRQDFVEVKRLWANPSVWPGLLIRGRSFVGWGRTAFSNNILSKQIPLGAVGPVPDYRRFVKTRRVWRGPCRLSLWRHT